MRTVGGNLKFLFNDTIFYGGLTIVSRLIGIVLLPIVGAIFSVDQFGVIDSLRVFFELAILLCLFGLNQGVSRFMFQADDENEKRSIVTQGLVIILILTSLVCLICMLLQDFILGFYLSEIKEEYVKAFLVLILSIPFSVTFTYFQMLLRWNFDKIKFAILTIGFLLLNLVGAIYALKYIEVSIPILFQAQFVAFATFSIIGGVFCWKYFFWKFKFDSIYSLFSYSFPLTLTSLLSTLIPSFDRFIISSVIGNTELGLYGMAYRVSSLTRMLTGAFSSAWGPFSFSTYKEENAAVTFNLVFRYVSFALNIFGMILVFLGLPLLDFFGGSKYGEAYVILPFLIFGFVFEAINEVSGVGVYLSKKTRYSAYSFFINLIVSFCIGYVLSLEYGILGVAFGFLSGKFGMLISKSAFAYYHYPLKFKFKLPTLYFLVSLSLSIGFVFLNLSMSMSIIYGIIAFVLYILVFYHSLSFDGNTAFDLIKSQYNRYLNK